jgi:hypothetical protein
VQIIRIAIALSDLDAMAEGMFGDLVKAVVDVERRLMAVGGEMHADEEALLLGDGSAQAAIWGINLYPEQFQTPRFIEYDSLINIRPRQGNRTRGVEDPSARAAIADVVNSLVLP